MESFAVVVGVDWADAKHDVCLESAGGVREFDTIAHGAEAIDQWIEGLHRRFGGMIAVALELSRGPLVYALQKYDFVTLFPVNPASLARYRETLHSSGAKDDPTDAELALELVLRHPERFKPLVPQSTGMRTLAYLVEQRRDFVDDRVRAINRLTTCLKQYYPQVLEWFEAHDTLLFCDFVTRWPTLPQAKRARRSTLERFFKEHRANRRDLFEKRLQAIRSALPLTEDPAIVDVHRLQALALIEQMRVAIAAVSRYEQRIAELAEQHEDYELYADLPGAGDALIPRLMTAMGEQRERFSDAAEVQMFSAIAPVTIRSGKQWRVQWRHQGSTFVRQTFVEWAAHSIHRSFWAGEYYRQQRARGKTHNVAVRALAFKWIRILYRCWKDHKPYNEAIYLKALQQRGSSLVAAP
jgi:transposase